MQLEDFSDAEDEAEDDIREVVLTAPQFELVTTKAKFPAMVAGFGSGKTEALITRAMNLKLAYPRNNVGYYLPTYDLVRTIAIPRFEEALGNLGLVEGNRGDYTINKSDKEIIIHDGGKIILRTMDTPGRIIGYEVGDSLVDELDTLKHEDAAAVWKKIIARNRQKKLVEDPRTGLWVPSGDTNTIAVGTTPEGFRFVYQQWQAKPPSEDYKIIRASTYSNAHNLPDDYIPNLLDAYPANLIAAYINGEFINLTSGAVYPDFDRALNGCSTTAVAGEPLHWGMDFNVGKMTSIPFVPRGEEAHAVGEIVGILDTPAMISAIKTRFPGHAHYVYPDASGASRKSNNASASDIDLLRQAGFTVFANPANPAVRDRVLSMNVMISSTKGRRLKVNAALAPSLVESLEKQAYDKNGEPDKTSGLDHAADAAGYFVCYRFPVIQRQMFKKRIGGH